MEQLTIPNGQATVDGVVRDRAPYIENLLIKFSDDYSIWFKGPDHRLRNGKVEVRNRNINVDNYATNTTPVIRANKDLTVVLQGEPLMKTDMVIERLPNGQDEGHIWTGLELLLADFQRGRYQRQ